VLDHKAHLSDVSKSKATTTGWCVYVVQCADDSLYTGIARNVSARVAEHNDGVGARYTRGRRPVRLVYVEAAADRGSALRREYEIKQLPAAAKRRLTRSAPR
jgi:putative endonuclease